MMHNEGKEFAFLYIETKEGSTVAVFNDIKEGKEVHMTKNACEDRMKARKRQKLPHEQTALALECWPKEVRLTMVSERMIG